MTFYFSYIGDIDDPDFNWEGPDGKKLPRRLLPDSVLGGGLGIDIFWVIKMIKEGRYEGKQLDWGSWGLKMTGAEIRALLGTTEMLSSLDPKKHYVLVAAEGV